MKAGGDASAGSGEALARSVKCSEVRSCLPLSLFPRFPSPCNSCLAPLINSGEPLFSGSPYHPRISYSRTSPFVERELTSIPYSAARYSRTPTSFHSTLRNLDIRTLKNRRKKYVFHLLNIPSISRFSLDLLFTSSRSSSLSRPFLLPFPHQSQLTPFLLSQYVPLTEEQRKAKLDDLRVKLAEKRAKQALVNVEENKANEVSTFDDFGLRLGRGEGMSNMGSVG